jgi:hypothetical protein
MLTDDLQTNPSMATEAPMLHRTNSPLKFQLPIELWQVGFVSDAGPDPLALGQPFGQRKQHQIVRSSLRTTATLEQQDLDSHPLSLIVVPHEPEGGLDALQHLQQWLDNSAVAASSQRTQLLSLQGAHMVWHPRCLAILVPAERVLGVAQAILEAHFYEMELRALETGVEDGWEATLKDAPLGFEFAAEDIPRRPALAARFQEVVQLRTRQTRLASHIIVPHVYPPTLASQIGERFRERLRMEERLELLDSKLSTQEHVYEMCSQRTSDYMVARTGHHLEWAIIILLAFQTLLWLIDLSASASP